MQYPKDVYISESIAAKMKNKAIVIKKNPGVKKTMALVKKMEIMIGMRLHSLIYATNAGVPVVGLVYEPKIEGVLKDIGQASAGDVKKLEFEKLKSIVEGIWTNREQVRADLSKISARLKESAHQNARIAIGLLNGRE
jgi:polysaccharide pyruvyl transferase WcaK-like protein